MTMSQPNTSTSQDFPVAVRKDATTATVESDHDIESDSRDDVHQHESDDAAVGSGQERALGSSKALWAWIILCFSVSRSFITHDLCAVVWGETLT
jgi:hypothetical protein